MKKRIVYLIIVLLCLFVIPNVKAGSISLYSTDTAVVGNNVVVTVNISNDVTAWDFTVGYDTSKLRFVSSNLEKGAHSVSTFQMHGNSRTYNMTFRAISSGYANIYISSVDCGSVACNKGSKSILLRTQSEIEASYSKNNNLKNLSIDGVTLSPEFNSDTLEYTAVAEAGTDKINVTGSQADQNASISGIGEKEVTEGDNNIEVVVTAENGSTKTYVIKLTVKEFDPIKVKMDKDYTVVRNKNNLTPPTNYEEKNVKIGNEEVPAYYNDITKYTIVALKDDKGVQNWYVKDKDKYTLYKEIKFGMTTLYPMDLDKIPDGYSKTKIKYNKETINCYKTKDSSKYALIYGMNVETGEKHIYMYDSKEDTVQIYNDELINKLQDDNKLYLKILIGLSVGLVLSIGIIIFILLKNKKKNI